ncbi:MAG TPA: hypothetical protein VF678_00230 [bacterium]
MEPLQTSTNQSNPGTDHDPLAGLAKTVRRATALLWTVVALLTFSLIVLLSN